MTTDKRLNSLLEALAVLSEEGIVINNDVVAKTQELINYAGISDTDAFILNDTRFGKQAVIAARECGYFVFTWRNVRTINDDEQDEQELINELEAKEKPLERKLMLRLWSMYNALRTNKDYDSLTKWENHNKADFNEYYYDAVRSLNEQVDDCSFQYAEKSQHGWCL